MISPAPPTVANITGNRSEAKYRVPRAAALTLTRTLNERLAPHHFSGEGANRLPDADHYVTTVYFDTPGYAHLRAAEASPRNNVKLRAREYYDLHRGLIELATSPEAIVRYQPWVWFELKTRAGARTEKQRARIPKRAVPWLFATGALDVEQLDSTTDSEALHTIVEYCQGLPEPLSASCLVNYRRLSWQSTDETLRVTMDFGLSVFQPPSDLWNRTRPLVRGELGPALHEASYAIVEVKRRVRAPAWLNDALEGGEAQPLLHGKFVQAAAIVQRHGG